MKKFLDESVSRWKCFWMKVYSTGVHVSRVWARQWARSVGGDRRRSRQEVVVGDQKLLVVLCLRESSVRVLSAQRQCSSSLVQEMELSRMCRRKGVRFIADEQEGVTRCGQPVPSVHQVLGDSRREV